MSEIFEEPETDEEDEEEELEEGDEEEEEVVEPASLGEASLEEILAKRGGEVSETEEEEESLLDLTPDERIESLSIRPVPKQANEFVCANCHLVKHQSQLADPARQLCRDCV